MAKHNDLGIKGEKIAADFLYAAGYSILKKNHRIGRAEIDIIAKTENIIVFIEVKTRSTNRWGAPEIAVDKRKINVLAEAAAQFMQDNFPNSEMRFDIISIVCNDLNTPILEHFEDVYFPME
jgi:putative endonuclease